MKSEGQIDKMSEEKTAEITSDRSEVINIDMDNIGQVKDKASFIEGFKSRKLLFSIGTILLTALLLIGHYLNGEVFAQITSITVVGYLTGNVAQNVMGKKQ